VTDAGIVAAFRTGLRAVSEFREEWTTYWLRHSFVTYAMADLTADEVAQLAGHSVAIAEGTYSHPDDEVILKRTKVARDKLAKIQKSSNHASQVDALVQTISPRPTKKKIQKTRPA
jgi:integrase